jgi:hypothetical protein
MSDRLDAELVLLRSEFPDLEFHDEDRWVRLTTYPVSEEVWGISGCEVAFRIPLPGQPPYGFLVRPGLTPASGGEIHSYSYPVATPFGNDWGQFSWSPDGEWLPGASVERGANMLRWAQSFALRLAEGA